MKRDQDYFRGCLLGGAVGDALGAPVEFLRYNQIIRKYGQGGIRDLETNSEGLALFTDDTQMTLFTAEGILRAYTRGNSKGIWDPPTVVFHAYQRWLVMQGYPKVAEFARAYDGWLLGVKELYASRGPGSTCLSALLSGKPGMIETPINNSKGCGGVMRVAPAGLAFTRDKVFSMGAEFAALTHGHPSGYLSAGTLAQIIFNLIEGQDLVAAVEDAMQELEKHKDHEECSTCLRKALSLVQSNLPDQQAIRQIGEGWVGEEALAITVYCALKYQDDLRGALIAAVNHDGDSDSTGAITGNILGAYLGVNAIPQAWLEKLELREVITELADDLLVQYRKGEDWWQKYPGY
jgi:ADP-ribosylglycohydrolase